MSTAQAAKEKPLLLTIPHCPLRVLIFCVSLEIMALGIAFSISANLGTSPISSLTYVASLITPLTVGKATICLHCFLIALQIIILRKNYQPMQLLQLPAAFLFGYLTDFSIWMLGHIMHYSTYWEQWLLCICGIIVISFGISLAVISGITSLAVEGFCLTICKVKPVKFGNIKVICDVSLVAAAAVLSLIFLHGLYGVREGTVAAAICVGLLAKQILKPMKKFEHRFLD